MKINNKLSSILDRKNLLSIYFTAGYPGLEDTIKNLDELQSSGVDFVEIGFPFSDPIADGPVIQESSMIALKNGMTLDLLFKQLLSAKELISVPVILMGYLNPVLQFGVEKFCASCRDAGVSGVIIPDLPMLEFKREYRKIFSSFSLAFIFLITPQTSKERILEIDSLTDSFIYAVSSSSTTGTRENFDENQFQYLEELRDLNLKNPIIVGFGISNHETFKRVNKYAAGAIIGSSFISFLKTMDNQKSISQFIDKIRIG